MQGFILSINRARNEDLVISILTKASLMTLYRFYGARHSTINLGYKIDFETESSIKTSIARLRDVYHLGFSWMSTSSSLILWQQFIALFHPHLRDAEELDDFYFNLLDEASHLWSKQNPKRVAIEAYAKLLSHEGRLHSESICFFCDKEISEDKLSLIRAYLPAHTQCCNRLSISKQGFDELNLNHSTLFLDDKEIDALWITLLEGL